VLIVGILALSFLAVLPVHADSGIIIDQNVYFGYTNGWLNFLSTVNFTTVYQDTTNNFWYFDNIGIYLDGGNATITSWLINNQTVFNLTSISYTTTVTVNVTNIWDIYSVQAVNGVDTSTLGSGPYAQTNDSVPFGYEWGTGVKSGYTNENMTFSFVPLVIQAEHCLSSGSVIADYTTWQDLATTSVSTGQYFDAVMVVLDNTYVANLQDVEFEFSGIYYITLDWNSGNWNILTGSPYATLNTTACQVYYQDSWTAIFVWSVCMTGSQEEGQVWGLPWGMKANDTSGNYEALQYINQETNSSLWTLTAYSVPSTGTTGNTGSNNSTQSNNSTSNQNTYPATNTTQQQTNQTQTQIPIPSQTIEVPASVQPQLLIFGVVAICLIVGIVGYYSGKKRKDPLASARKTWREQND